MSWDEIYKKLEDELGRKPDSGEVQIRILEMLESGMEAILPLTPYHSNKGKTTPTPSIYCERAFKIPRKINDKEKIFPKFL